MKSRLIIPILFLLISTTGTTYSQTGIDASVGFTGIYNNLKPSYNGTIGYNLGCVVSFESIHSIGINYEYMNVYGDIYKYYDNDRIKNPTSIYELDYNYRVHELSFKHSIHAGIALSYINTFEYELNDVNTAYFEKQKELFGVKLYAQVLGYATEFMQFTAKVGYFYAPVDNERTDHAFDLKGLFVRVNFLFRIKEII